MPLDPGQLAALAAVLRTGSFDAAAAQLSVTPSAISQRIKALEERMGTVLVLRGQPCSGTEAGRRVARHAAALELMESELLSDISGHGRGAPQVRIALNADSLDTWFPQALAGEEGLVFELVVDDQDHSDDWLRRGEVAAAITSHAAAVQGCDSIALGALRYRATASPRFVARHLPEGLTADALARAPMLQFDRKDRLQRQWLRARTGRVLSPPTHLIPSSTAFVEMAEAGLGWGLNPEPLAQAALRAGRLVDLDPAHPHDTPLYWQISRLFAGPLARLTRSVQAAARAGLVQR